ncbi:ImmA/IrrE family metallo-endopeptidase [Aeromonas enteropelogenes]|uniref:ImmA/IrrE family metallo-endopeptidase n=1 Tax=Aeromonas enteropelogenes TaxID=29489 RepID=UPI003B9DE1DA
MQHRKLGHKVKPRSSAAISELAQVHRDLFHLSNPKANMAALYEVLQDAEIISFEVVEDHELGQEEALAFPDKRHIQLKQSVYDAACSGVGHSIFTLAHELGHIIMHRGEKNSFARGEHKIYEDSEWQADTFASMFLMDERHIDVKHDTPEDLAKRFGVSPEAAAMRLRKLKQNSK